LKVLGLVVEELTPQAAACGLTQEKIEDSVSKSLSDGGFSVRRNSDEETYLYVNVITSSVSTGLCVSRYDVFLTTHATATLSYQTVPVAVEVTLLRKGGMSGTGPTGHGEAVLRGVKQYVDQFVTRIHEASK
jgi:hypothetical protein